MRVSSVSGVAARALAQTTATGVVLLTAGVLLAARPQTTPDRRLQVERDAIATLEHSSARSVPVSAAGAFERLASLGEPTPFEHLWVLAYVASWERAVALGSFPVELEEAVERGLRRFPQDSRLLLARLMARPEARAVSNRPGIPADRLARFWGAGTVRRIAQQPGPNPRFVPNPKAVPRTRDGLRALASDAVVGDEARARLALLEYLLGDLDASLAAAASASASTDPFVRNLAGVVAGLAWDARAQPERALAAYRAAVEAMPRSTAAVAFARHAFLVGQRADAARALAEALPPRPFVFDPWDGLSGAERFLPQYLADLRTIAGLQPHPDNLVNPSYSSSLDLNEWNNRRLNPPSAEPPLLMRVLVPALPVAASNTALPTSPAAPPVQAAQTDARTFRTTTTAVFVDVSVRRNNRPVSGLTAADFEVLDNGVPQTVDDVTVEPLPLDVTIVIDTANSVPVGSGGVVHDPFADVARRLPDILGALRPDDRVRIIEANVRSVELLPWRSMRDLAGRAFTLNSFRPSREGPAAAICDATAAALMHPTPVNRRSLVLVLTDGIDGVSLTTTAELARVAQESDGTVILVRNETEHEQTVGRRQARGLPVPVDRQNEGLLWPKDIVGLERAVRDSGGYVFNVRDSTTSADRVREVLADFAKRYVLRYSPRGVPPDGWHALTVRVNRSGNYNIHARRGYFGG